MDRKIGIDLWIACICAAVTGIAWIYMGEGSERTWVLTASGSVMLFFILLAFLEKGIERRKMRRHGTERSFALPAENGSITDLVLLSEEETELMVWDMYGKVSLVIGRDTGENQVDVDLSQSPYSGMVDVEHAVLNFSAGNWYIEDVGSVNGISVRKAQDGKSYRLSADTPCRVESGDILLIGMNRLLIR